jgi:hypothetical protein
MMKLVTRGRESGKLYITKHPLGFLPLVAPGMGISQGQILDVPITATVFNINIENLAHTQEIDAGSNLPRSLYSFDGHRGWGQRLFRYAVQQGELLVPTTELLRHLFLHSKTLTYAAIDAVGLPSLAATPNPGYHSEIEIHFSGDVPVSLLSPDFVKEFAWLACDPDGRASWDSIYNMSDGQKYLSFKPPPLKTGLKFRGVKLGNKYLVLQILRLSGRKIPCNQIVYTHPAKLSQQAGDKRLQTDVQKGEYKQPIRIQHVLDDESSSKRDGSQPAITINRAHGWFENDIPVIRKYHENPASPKSNEIRKNDELKHEVIAPGRQTNTPVIYSGPVKRHRSSSVQQFSGGGKLTTLEFKLLTETLRDFAGETEALAKVIEVIAERYPNFDICMSFCFLPPGYVVSMTTRSRRTCLIAIFRRGSTPPVILLDVNHEGIPGIAAILIRYTKTVALLDIETDVHQLLGAFVTGTGRWSTKVEDSLRPTAVVSRIHRLLRTRRRHTEGQLLVDWPERLLGLIWPTR